MRIRRMMYVTALAVLLPMAARGEPARPPIYLGMSTALSGPAQSLGSGMKAGMEAYFTRINRGGGLYRRELVLITMDDGYVPQACGAEHGGAHR